MGSWTEPVCPALQGFFTTGPSGTSPSPLCIIFLPIGAKQSRSSSFPSKSYFWLFSPMFYSKWTIRLALFIHKTFSMITLLPDQASISHLHLWKSSASSRFHWTLPPASAFLEHPSLSTHHFIHTLTGRLPCVTLCYNNMYMRVLCLGTVQGTSQM